LKAGVKITIAAAIPMS